MTREEFEAAYGDLQAAHRQRIEHVLLACFHACKGELFHVAGKWHRVSSALIVPVIVFAVPVIMLRGSAQHWFLALQLGALALEIGVGVVGWVIGRYARRLTYTEWRIRYAATTGI